MDCGQHSIVMSDSATDGEMDLYYRQPTISLQAPMNERYEAQCATTAVGRFRTVMPCGREHRR
jgi:hypothetical protein